MRKSMLAHPPAQPALVNDTPNAPLPAAASGERFRTTPVRLAVPLGAALLGYAAVARGGFYWPAAGAVASRLHLDLRGRDRRAAGPGAPGGSSEVEGCPGAGRGARERGSRRVPAARSGTRPSRVRAADGRPGLGLSRRAAGPGP